MKVKNDHLLSGYDFDLPEALIAQGRVPLSRERLLSVDENGVSTDQSFDHMIDTVDTNTVFILNNTKVVKARLVLKNVLCINPEGKEFLLESGEVFVYEILDDLHAEVLVSDGKHFRPGWSIQLSKTNVVLQSEKFVEDGIVMTILGGLNWWQVMEEYGNMPLPPYVEHDVHERHNKQLYQTEFAKEDGSVAAPTASLRFTREVLDRLDEKGIEYGFVTLHVGLGTFKPLYKEDVREHELHREAASVSISFLKKLAQWKKDGKKIIAVGTTVCRVLESLSYIEASEEDESTLDVVLRELCEHKKDTQNWINTIDFHENELRFFTKLFVYPGFEFTLIDGLITNFHLPKTSLLVLVTTLMGGQEKLLEVYAHAIEQKYRFYSFGDGMMISRKMT